MAQLTPLSSAPVPRSQESRWAPSRTISSRMGAALDLGNDVGRLPRPADLVLQVQAQRQGPPRIEQAGQPQTVLAPDLRDRNRGDRAPRDRVPVEQIPWPRRLPRAAPRRRGREPREAVSGAAMYSPKRSVEALHRLGANQNDRAASLAPSRSKSAGVPAPPSTSRAVRGGVVDGARAYEHDADRKANRLDELRRRPIRFPLRRNAVGLQLDRVDARPGETPRPPTVAPSRSPRCP